MIIKSLLDLDLYKLTMMQLAWKNFPDLVVKFKFNNRTDIDLSRFIPSKRIEEEFNEVKKLTFTNQDISYLETLEIFEKEFLNYLQSYTVPDIIVNDNDEEGLEIYTIGHWKDVIIWETIVLGVVNELYYRHKYSEEKRNKAIEIGRERLNEKLSRLTSESIPGITDFGTRRRFSSTWHEEVVKTIANHPSFTGTSNVHFAREFGMKPIGTNAHELYMISAGYYGEDDLGLKSSHSYIMNQWFHMYGFDLSIGLTDTFGTKFFFEDFKDKAAKWKGLRHDSGDPFVFGENVIEYYQSLNIDPKTKLLVFSDGLSLDKIIDLYETFSDRINVSFGWGTKLTNDVGFETLSIVMKAVEVISNGDQQINRTLVKLSDNLNKHTGEPEEINRYKNVFEYVNTESEKLVV